MTGLSFDCLFVGALLRLVGKLQTSSTAGSKHGAVSLPVEMLYDDAGYIHNHQEEQREGKEGEMKEAQIGTGEDNYSADLV